MMLAIQFAFKPYHFLTKLFIAICVAITITVAVEDKPFYVYLLAPNLFLAFAIAVYRLNPELVGLKCLVSNASRMSGAEIFIILGLILLTVIGVSLVIFGIREGAYPYFTSLVINARQGRESFAQELWLSTIYLTSPIMFVSKNYSFSGDYKYLIISSVSFAPLYVWLLYRLFRSCLTWARLVQLSFLSLVIIFLIMKNTIWGHHFVFLHIPLVTALMVFCSKSEAANHGVMTALGVNVLVMMVLIQFLPIQSYYDRSRDEVLEYLKKDENAERAVINFSSWGGYYILELYGPRFQLVTKEFLDLSVGRKLQELANESGRRRILNVCYECDIASMKESFPNTTIVQSSVTQMGWKIFEITPVDSKGF
jgi:hypothetical protein